MTGARFARSRPVLALLSTFLVVWLVALPAQGSPRHLRHPRTRITSLIHGRTSLPTTSSVGIGGLRAPAGAHVLLGTTEECDGLVPSITGTDGPDQLMGTAGDDVILGLDGDDTIQALAGDDTVCSGAGNDTIDMGPGGSDPTKIDIVYSGDGDDEITGGPDQDQISPGAGVDTVHGGANPPGSPDLITYLWAAQGVSVDLVAGIAEGEGSDTFDGVEGVFGSLHADVIVGDSGDNFLNGGSYLLFSGSPAVDQAADVISGGGNSDPQAFVDVLEGVGGGDQLSGGDGIDHLYGNAGADLLSGDADGDSLIGGAGDDRLKGGPGFDEMHGQDGNDELRGGPDNDVLFGLGGNDRLLGGSGTDQHYPGEGIDQVNGGSQEVEPDIISYDSAVRGVDVNLTTGIALGQGKDQITGVEGVNGSLFGDRLVGDDQNNQFFGGLAAVEGGIALDEADDVLLGKGGHFDILLGLGGDDTYDGGRGIGDTADFLFSINPVQANLTTGTASGEGQDDLKAVEVLDGSFFDDVLTGDERTNIIIGNLGDDVIRGEGGIDFALFDQIYVDSALAQAFLAAFGLQAEFAPIVGSLATGSASGEGEDTVDSIEILTGGPLADTLTGDDDANGLFGGDGDDVLIGIGGNDLLIGEGGDDDIDGGDGFYDLASYLFAEDSISANLAAGSASGAGVDSLVGVEALTGSAFADDLSGDALANFIFGGGGDDSLDGADGDDFLHGGDGSDTLDGGPGTDDCSTGEFEALCEGSELPPDHPLSELVSLLEGFRHH